MRKILLGLLLVPAVLFCQVTIVSVTDIPVDTTRSPAVTGLARGSTGVLWASSTRGLWRVQADTAARVLIGGETTYTGKNRQYAIMAGSDSVLWIGTAAGLIGVNPLNQDVYHGWVVFDSLPRAAGMIAPDTSGSGALWIGARAADTLGLWLIQP